MTEASSLLLNRLDPWRGRREAVQHLRRVWSWRRADSQIPEGLRVPHPLRSPSQTEPRPNAHCVRVTPPYPLRSLPKDSPVRHRHSREDPLPGVRDAEPREQPVHVRHAWVADGGGSLCAPWTFPRFITVRIAHFNVFYLNLKKQNLFFPPYFSTTKNLKNVWGPNNFYFIGL